MAAICPAAQFDVVVYGGTSSGAMAAIAAAKAGKSTALIEPGRHLGGMLTGGLGRTDMDRQEALIGGLAREFFTRAGKHYGRPLAWFFEPKVAERIVNEMVAEAGVTVALEQRLEMVRKEGGRLLAIRTHRGEDYAGKVFIDATYEGDLLKAAGVSYAVGREDASKYGERYAGRQDTLPGGHQLRAAVPAIGEDGRLLPYLAREEDVVPTGRGDGKIQAYCFRLCLTSRPENRRPIPKPEGYNPARFGLVKGYIKALGDSVRLGDFLGISEMPNGKTDINAGGGVSTNLPGAGLEYVEASHQRRREIWEEHRSWAHGLLYFLANDESVPDALRARAREWGLTKDEFVDTDGWPHQMYIREARRMTGEFVLTERDLLKDVEKYDSVAMSQYNIDIREVQWIARTVYRFPNMRQEVLMEGYVSVPVKPYQIPYRSLVPRFAECENLIVPAAISASHVAFASYRMEPQFMMAGHAAGVAAALAIEDGRPVQRIDIEKLQSLLRRQGQVLTPADRKPAP